MKAFTPKGSLLWKILLSTSIAVTAVFALTGWMVQTVRGQREPAQP